MSDLVKPGNNLIIMAVPDGNAGDNMIILTAVSNLVFFNVMLGICYRNSWRVKHWNAKVAKALKKVLKMMLWCRVIILN